MIGTGVFSLFTREIFLAGIAVYKPVREGATDGQCHFSI
jgi:hypothetical protein